MNDSFKPITPERAEQIRQALHRARSVSQGLAIDRDTGEFRGAAPLNSTVGDKVNMIGKFDTHYSIVSDKKRLVLEHYAMRQRWGELPRWCCSADKSVFFWEYNLQLEGNAFPIRVAYPPDYPASPPELILQMQLPGSTPHLWPQRRTILPGARLCWYHPTTAGRSRNMWNPAEDTAAMAIGVAYRWCLAFTVWMTTGQWPVPDALTAGS